MAKAGLKTRLTLLIAAEALLLSAAFFGIQLLNLEPYADRVAGKTLGLKLEADSRSVGQYLKTYYGKVFEVGGTLVDRNLVPLDGRGEMVQAVKRELGVDCSLFVASSEGFRRVVSSIEEAGGTLLDPASPAYAPALRGEGYLGPAKVLGVDYYSSYAPLAGLDGEAIGLVFVGVPRSIVSDIVEEERGLTLLRVLAAGLAAALLLGFVAEYVLGRALAPLGGLAATLAAIAEGSGGGLRARLAVKGSDEVGRAASSFNAFAERVAGRAEGAAATLRDLDASARELAEGLGGVLSATGEIADEAGLAEAEAGERAQALAGVSGAAAEILGRATELSSAAGALGSGSAEARRAVEAMAAGVAAAAADSRRGAELGARLRERAGEGGSRLGELAGITRELAERQERLGAANELIAEVADKTAILALNAAIEAAHAGAYGRGFEVLAGEIRVLAEASAERSGEVAAVLEETMELVRAAASAAAGSESAFGAMEASLGEVEAAREELGRRLEAEAARTELVLDGLATMDRLSSEVAKGADSARDSARGVEATMAVLIQAARDSRERVARIHERLAFIESRIGEMRELGARNEAGVAAVAGLVEGLRASA